ncbi:ABC-2 transporter permease [Romboutsia sp.]|uniref:ABC-2 transporter permease n=1 Tax=Romboutsia sp. TaxID=1965302 RepID=UPI003F3EF8A4
MLKLLLKDLMASFKADTKTILKLIIGMMVFIFIFMPISTVTIPLFISYIFIFRSFYLDEHNKCDYFFNSMPIEKEDVVYSKYLYATIVIIVSTLIAYIYSQIIKVEYGFIMLQAKTIFIIFSLQLVMVAVSYPIMFKYGYNKSYVPLNLVLGVALILSMVQGPKSEVVMSDVPNFKPQIVQYYEQYQEQIIIAAVCLVIYIISMYISKKIYTKKEIAN